jgi:hypothetical protein
MASSGQNVDTLLEDFFRQVIASLPHKSFPDTHTAEVLNWSDAG